LLSHVRISAFNPLAVCPGLFVLQSLGESTSGKAADTGSLVGYGVEMFHLAYEGDAVAAALHSAHLMTLHQEARWPKADLKAAIRTVARYCEDTRSYTASSPFGIVVAERQEAEVNLTLTPDDDDPAGEPIFLTGHVDQPRRDPFGVLKIWDVKNTKRYTGVDALYKYAWQLAAYCVAATETWGEDVTPGGIILTQAYHGKIKGKKPASECGGVWISAPWSLSDCRAMLRQVAYQIGRVRAGLIAETPGPSCSYCPGEGPSNCGRAISDLLET